MELFPLRIFLYVFLLLVAAVVIGLSAARLNYTTRGLTEDDRDFFRISYYNPIVVELLVTAILTLLVSLFMLPIFFSHKRHPERTSIPFTFRGEFIFLIPLWILWLVGAAYNQHQFGNLRRCWYIDACRILTALEAFAWIGWILTTFLLIASIVFVRKNRAMRDPVHGRYWYDAEGRRQPLPRPVSTTRY